MIKLRWSQFVFFVKSKSQKRIIIHNTLNDSTVGMTKQIKDIVESVIDEKTDKDTVPVYIKVYIKKLTQLGILVPFELDEKENYLKMFHDTQCEEEKTFLIFLVTTRSCQFNCSYCFERGISQKEQLSTETADKIVLWCQNYLKKHQICNKLEVVLYGGEPLLNKKIIKYILPKLYDIAGKKNILFSLDIITNGELLDLEILSFLRQYNLNMVKITLDGPKKIHDKRRIRKDGKGTFDKIIQNILMGFRHNLLQKVHLHINFDRQNVHSIPKLFDLLVAHNLQQKIEFSFISTFPIISEQLGRKILNSHFTKFGFSENENIDKYLWLCQEAKKRGLNIPKKWMIGPVCSATKIHSVVIEPDGTLLKCPRTVGQKEFVFGNISFTNEAYDRNFNKFDYLKKCLSKSCPLLPLCNGGCRFQAYVSSRNSAKTYCKSKFIEKINKGLVQLNFI